LELGNPGLIVENCTSELGNCALELRTPALEVENRTSIVGNPALRAEK